MQTFNNEKETTKVSGRELKFRVWDKEEKRMVNVIESLYFPLGKPSGKDICYDEADNGFAVVEDRIPYRGWLYNYELMQYTGLKDKNGKEIYESSVVRIEPYTGHIRLYEVVYSRASFVLRRIIADDDVRISMQDDYQMEVIGNIYENPELLTNN